MDKTSLTKLVRGCVDRAKGERSYLTNLKNTSNKLQLVANSARSQEMSHKMGDNDEVIETDSATDRKIRGIHQGLIKQDSGTSNGSSRLPNSGIRPVRDSLMRRERSKSPLFKDRPSRSPVRSVAPANRPPKLVLKPSNLTQLTRGTNLLQSKPMKSTLSGTLSSPFAKAGTVRRKETRLRVQDVEGAEESLRGSKFEDFVVGNLIGQGAYATSFLAYHNPTGVSVAFKVYTFGEKPVLKNAIDMEEKLLRKLHHPNIVRLFTRFDRQNKTYFVLELCPQRSLKDLLRVKPGKKLSEKEALVVMKQLMSAVEMIHSRGVTHCDLKLDNILIDEGNLNTTLIDFGCSAEHPEADPPEFVCGSPAYMPPEQISNKGLDFYKADVWSLGVVLYTLVTGIFPFKGKTLDELQRKIVRMEFNFPTGCGLSQDLKKLLRKMMSPAESRISAKEVLMDAWLKSSC